MTFESIAKESFQIIASYLPLRDVIALSKTSKVSTYQFLNIDKKALYHQVSLLSRWVHFSFPKEHISLPQLRGKSYDKSNSSSASYEKWEKRLSTCYKKPFLPPKISKGNSYSSSDASSVSSTADSYGSEYSDTMSESEAESQSSYSSYEASSSSESECTVSFGIKTIKEIPFIKNGVLESLDLYGTSVSSLFKCCF